MINLNIGEQIAIGILFFSIVTKNKSVAIATGAILILRLLNLRGSLSFIEKNGVNIGVIILTAGCLAPFLMNKYTAQELKSAFLSLHGIIGILAGMLVAFLAGRGAHGTYPFAVLGVVVGTFIGVGIFRGVPVGPMIGTGIAVTMIGVVEHFMDK